jgi:hypothetical protein
MLKVANSLFFQIDLLTDISITLVKEKENRISRETQISMKSSSAKDETKLLAPKREYDDEAMAYYWYAKNTKGMTLLSFLAYYQVIEFYFPKYSALKAKNHIKGITT